MKKVLKSLVAIALAIVLLVPANVFAASEASINKTLTVTGEDAFFNGNTYKYTLKAVKSESYGKFEGKEAQEGLLTISNNGEIVFEAGSPSGTKGSVNLVVNEEKLQTLQPGVYDFEVTETAKSVDGESNTLLNKTIRVFVSRNAETGKMEAKLIVSDLVDSNKDGIASKEFAKTYLSSETKFETKALTVTKEVKGNQANLDESFPVKIVIKGQAGDVYTYYDEKGNGNSVQVNPLTLEAVINTNVKHGTEFKINGLTELDTYTVEETDAKGYTASQKLGDMKVELINELESTVPTGVIETVAPFAIMIVAALAFAVVYFRKRQEA